MTDEISPPDSTSKYRVAVFAEPDDPHELADVIATKLGLHLTDARVHAHAVPGILPALMSQTAAEELAESIGALGIRTDVIAQADMPHLEQAEVLHHVRCLEEGLEVIDLHGKPNRIIDWDDIQLISIGHVPQESQRRYVVETTSSIHAGPHHLADTPKVPPKSGPEAWIIRRSPEAAYRIEHNQMNYEYLDDRKEGSATHNFRLLIDDLVARIPHAYLTPAAHAYVDHGHLGDYEFQSLEEHRRYTLFHLLLLRQMKQSE